MIVQDRKWKPSDIRFVVSVRDSSGNRYGGTQYANFMARAMVWAKEEGREYDLYSPDSYSTHIRAAELDGLEITAQMDSHTVASSTSPWYAFSVHYHRNNVSLFGAEDIVKVLRKISKRMDAIAEQYGRPADLAAFATHAASAITGPGHVFLRHVGKGTRADFNGTGYRPMNTDDLRCWLMSEVDMWASKNGVTVTS